MRSWLSEVSSSTVFMPGSRRATRAASTSMPMPAFAAVSDAAHDRPGRAEVLHADREPALEQLEARLDQPLLLERVADLHRRPLLLRARLEAGRREHARAADAVATGRRAEQHREVAGPVGAGEHEPFVRAARRGTAR